MSGSFPFPPPQFALPRGRNWRWLHTDPEACVRLWCFPCIGAGIAIWRSWTQALSGAAELAAISLPGREARWDEAPHTRLAGLADVIARELAPNSNERDVFCGYGFGAILAFEVACRLHNANAPGPRALIVCGAPPPHQRWAKPPLHQLEPREFLRAVERYYGPIPPEFFDQPDYLELLLPAVRADLEALETYHYPPRSPLNIPLLAVAGRDDPLASRAMLVGWRLHTTSRFELAQLDGTHFVISENPMGVAVRVREFLATL